MLLFSASVEDSKIPRAGKGLFTKEPLTKGKVVIIPNQKHSLYSTKELAQFSPDSIEQQSSVRWFEDVHAVDPEWSEESHLNHSYTPNLLWHLGFAFTLRDINAGEELTIDYSHLLDENYSLGFNDSITGKPITGLSFNKKMQKTSRELCLLFEQLEAGKL